MNAVELANDISREWMQHFNRFSRMNELLLDPPQIKTGQAEKEIIYRRHKVKLYHYKPTAEKVYETPMLISYALVNKPYIMDLLPGRSIIEVLLAGGIDVYLIDWGSPTGCDNDKGIEVYVNDYLDAMVNKTLESAGVEKLNLLGYCMGGTLALIYTALNQDKVKNLILMAAPFDCSTDDGLLFQWARDMKVEEIAEIYGNTPGWFIATSFLFLNPTSSSDKAMSFYKGVLDDSFLELFLAMEKWINDTVNLSGRAYTEFMTWFFQQNLLKKEQFELGGRRVDLRSITCPFLNLIAELDTSVPPASGMEIGSHLSSSDRETITCKVGHIGLAVSGKSLKTLWPRAIEWVAKRSGNTIETQH